MKTLILGGPGCGKTTALLNVMDEALQSGIPPERIAFMSFSRAAAHEARDRAVEKFGLNKSRFPYMRTLHSLGYYAARMQPEQVMQPDNYKELANLLHIEYRPHRADPDMLFTGGSSLGEKLIFIEEQARSRMVSYDVMLAANGGVDKFTFRQYVKTLKEYKEENALYDYTDMIEMYSNSGKPIDVDVFIIDEAQDLSPLQWQVVERAIPSADHVYFAGDDDQAIHAWCGADVHHFLELGKQVDDIRVLNKSYRLSRDVFEYANGISSCICDRYDKDWSPREEVGDVQPLTDLETIADQLREGTWMLLARNREFLLEYENTLKSMGVYYCRVGQDSPVQKYVDAIMEWEKLLKGRSVSLASVKKIYSLMSVGKGVARGHKQMKGADDLASYSLDELQEHHGLLTRAGWEEALDKVTPQARAYMISCRKNGERLTQAPRVRIGTIHSVKGMEADNVVLRPDMSYPTYRDMYKNMDDEHRVFYVGASRARHGLYLLYPRRPEHYRL